MGVIVESTWECQNPDAPLRMPFFFFLGGLRMRPCCSFSTYGKIFLKMRMQFANQWFQVFLPKWDNGNSSHVNSHDHRHRRNLEQSMKFSRLPNTEESKKYPFLEISGRLGLVKYLVTSLQNIMKSLFFNSPKHFG